ncbi:MAG TPA: alpha/beta hydrolase [Prolixibacteraceae bacterium]|jgi:pimeloyl-ACP methyl ester carboxylesterase|nr:alpha/beta hydrolase [Prolixibacteraceae bacterium]
MILFGIVALLCIIALVIIWLIPGYTRPIKDGNGFQMPGSIASLEQVNLGGQDQWILIRGKDTAKPVILFLHGGPGLSEMALLRRHMHELEKHFVLVSWDQRGTGKSFKAIYPEYSMTINQFLSDVHQLTKLLIHRFKQQKIFLIGHSWGSVLGILSIQKHPELYKAYIGIGQVVNMQDNERLSYEWTLEQARIANDRRTINKLIEIGKPPYTGDWQKKLITERRLLGKYGGELYGSSYGAFPMFIGSMIRSGEYSLPDIVNFFKGISTSIRLLWPELMTINLMKLAPRLEVPIYFALGKHDYETPYPIADQYFNQLEAPFKKLIWFDNSAHLPHIEENEKFINLLVNHILPASFIHEVVTSPHSMNLNE